MRNKNSDFDVFNSRRLDVIHSNMPAIHSNTFCLNSADLRWVIEVGLQMRVVSIAVEETINFYNYLHIDRI